MLSVVRRAALLLGLGVGIMSVTACDRGSASDVATPEPEPVPEASPPPAPEPPVTRSRVADNPPGWPPVEFEPAELHFGLLAPDETGRETVHVYNVGDQVLRVRGSSTTCGCTTTDIQAGQVIEPGASIDFDVEMKPKPGLGDKREAVGIFFHGYEPRVEFYFQARVAFPVHVTPPAISATAQTAGELLVESQDGQPFGLLWSNGEPPDFVDFDPNTDAPRNSYTFRWDISDAVARDDVPWFWVIETDRAECPIIDIRVQHQSTIPHRPRHRPWVPKGQRMLIGRVAPGEPIDITASIEFSDGFPPSPAAASISGAPSRYEAELVEATVDGQILEYHIRITPHADARGLVNEEIELVASGFEAPLYVIGRIIEPDG